MTDLHRFLSCPVVMATALGAAGPLGAQEPAFLVKDIATHASGQSSVPSDFVTVGPTTFFVATTEAEGAELWKTDGTEDGTVLVKDIRPGPHDYRASRITSFAVSFAEKLFFAADDGAYGPELWMSDGAVDGTTLVRDICPGFGGSFLREPTVVDGHLLFIASDCLHGEEIWISDGSEAGTRMLKDIRAGSAGSLPSSAFGGELIGVEGTLFFVADDGVHGIEIWRSDLTPEGTQLVVDLAPGLGSSYPSELTESAGRLFFSAFADGEISLWTSEAPGEVVTEVAVFPTTEPFALRGQLELAGLDGTLFFVAPDDEHGLELWKSDGTPEGTVLVRDIRGGPNSSSPRSLMSVGGILYFTADDGLHGRELWRSDGAPEGTVLVRDIEPGPDSSEPRAFADVGETLFFSASVGGKRSIWKSDGTLEGTEPIDDLGRDFSASPRALIANDGTLFFAAGNNSGLELWTSEGDASTTRMLKNIAPDDSAGSYPMGLADVNGRLFFIAQGDSIGVELWTSDGTSKGTTLVKDIHPIFSSLPRELTPFNGAVLFGADDGSTDGLWRSDGTEEGTTLVGSESDSGPIHPSSFTRVGSTLFFQAFDESSGWELWASDGTERGTVLVKDILPGLESSYPSRLTAVRNRFFFTTRFRDPTLVYKLWISDGSESGTVPIAEALFLYPLAAVGDRVFLLAFDERGSELWISDGTPAGTSIVKDINPDRDSSSIAFETAEIDGRLFFVADDGSHGGELWMSDGTADGTRLVRDIYSGHGSSGPQWLTEVGGRLFFAATAKGTGREIWTSNGTEEGTFPVQDVVPGAGSLNPDLLTSVAGRLVFRTCFAGACETWVTDGTERGTRSLAAIAPNSRLDLSDPYRVVGQYLFFAANDGTTGQELWALPVSEITAEPVQQSGNGGGGGCELNAAGGGRGELACLLVLLALWGVCRHRSATWTWHSRA